MLHPGQSRRGCGRKCFAKFYEYDRIYLARSKYKVHKKETICRTLLLGLGLGMLGLGLVMLGLGLGLLGLGLGLLGLGLVLLGVGLLELALRLLAVGQAA